MIYYRSPTFLTQSGLDYITHLYLLQVDTDGNLGFAYVLQCLLKEHITESVERKLLMCEGS